MQRFGLVVVASALVLTACGGGSGGVLELPADEVLATAVERSTTLDSARLRTVTRTATAQGEQEVTAEGVSNGQRARMTGTTTDPMTGEPVDIEVRLVDGTMYVRQPALVAALGGSVDWYRIDLEAVAPGLEAMVQQADQFDPTTTLEQLGEIARISEVGRERVNGVATKHYTAETTYGAALAAAGLDEELVRQFADTSGIDLDSTVPMQLWIDDQGLVRKQRVEITGDGFTTETTTEFVEYGVTVDVAPPPAEATVDLQQLVGAG